MVERIRGLFKGSQFVASGSLIKLADIPNDFYAKSTIFMNAKITIKNWKIHIKNDDYDPDQEQSEFLSFEIDEEMEMAHFTVFDYDQTQIDSVKWKNLNTFIIETASIIGFEFSSPNECQKFLNLIQEMVNIQEEGVKRFEDRPKNLKPAQNKLNASTQLPPSLNKEKTQIKPQPLQKEEEDKIQRDFNFKEKVIFQLQNLYTPDQIVFCSPGNLYLNLENTREQYEEGIGFLVVKHEEFSYTLDLVRESKIIMRNVMDKDFAYEIDAYNHTISWIEQANNTQRYWTGYLIENIFHLQTLFLVAQFESSRYLSVEVDLSAEDKEWLKKEDSDQEEISDGDEMEIEYRNELRSEEVTGCILDSATYYGSPYMLTAKENSIGVYQLGYESLNLVNDIPVKYNRKIVQPSQLLFHQQGSKLLLLNNKDKNGIFEMDMNRNGEIVQKYSPGKGDIVSICSHEKLSQLTIDPLFLAMGENSLFTIDTRMSGKKQVCESKLYAKNYHFTCLSTTIDGNITVGNKTGEIRMYKQIGENSRNNLPGFGEGITSIDATKDGSWILATTDKFLIATPTQSNEGESGFLKKLGKKKQKPRKLVLKPEDIYKYQLTNHKFTAARFDVAERDEESVIITSRGKFLIIWNFNSIKKGKLDNYKVKEIPEEPIKNEFKFNEKNSWTTHLRALRFQRNNFGFE
ncbi:unnamed protein product [Blepharisma stoltei]|uniref:Vacuolar import/degradation Vid27 C-terminal domain-containing protein n=1 Tax=Blepharisma stoltei TaxID=1481888 RepID=A0AAU9IJS9_9CILI|nr:unnamed protein product [Blepharisma stoltei]